MSILNGYIYTFNGLLKYFTVVSDTPRVVVNNHGDLQLWMFFEYHEATVGEHRGREKTYITDDWVFTGFASINVSASMFVHTRSVNWWSLALLFVPRISHCPSRLSAGNPFPWISSSHSRLYAHEYWYPCVRWQTRCYTWLLCLKKSTHRVVLVYLLTRPFAFMGCFMNSCPIGTRGPQLSSGTSF